MLDFNDDENIDYCPICGQPATSFAPVVPGDRNSEEGCSKCAQEWIDSHYWNDEAGEWLDLPSADRLAEVLGDGHLMNCPDCLEGEGGKHCPRYPEPYFIALGLRTAVKSGNRVLLYVEGGEWSVREMAQKGLMPSHVKMMHALLSGDILYLGSDLLAAMTILMEV